MKYNGVIQRKLALLDSQLVMLEKHLGTVTIEEFRESWMLRSMTERALQVCVEIVIDVCERIIALEGHGPVASGSECVDKMVSLGLLPAQDPFKSMIRFRNFVVHQYEQINPEILFDLARNKSNDFRQFISAIDKLSNDGPTPQPNL